MCSEEDDDRRDGEVWSKERIMEDRKDWKMSEWNQVYSTVPLPPMTNEEIQEGIAFLRSHNYPKPTDCPKQECPKYRPACQLGICRIAVGMCRDF